MCEEADSEDESYNITARYRTVRKRLDNLGYNYALSVDTLPLVERLLVDFIKTTESLKHFKAIAQNNIESNSQQALSVDPYKCDNAKLVQECNKVHADLIESKEIHLKQTKELKRKINRLEAECSDLQLASSRNLKRIKDLELESSNKSKRIQELLGKCLKPTVSNAGLAAKRKPCYPLRRPAFEGEPLPNEILKTSSSFPSLSKVSPKVLDLVGMADRKISSLNHEVTKLRGELISQGDNVQTLQTQVILKEKEISRLRKMLDGGRPYAAVSKDCSCRKTEQNCTQCNPTSNRKSGSTHLHSNCIKTSDLNDIRILQQAKSNLEQQLRDALEKQHDAMSQAMKLAERNEELEKELRDIDHIALAVEADCNSTVKENNKMCSQLQEKLEKMSSQIRDLEASLLGEKRTNQELSAEFEACKLEKRNIQRALDGAIEDKKQLTDRINQLTLIEQALNNEIDRLSRLNETQKHEIMQLESATNSMKKQMSKNSSSLAGENPLRLSKDKGDKNDKNQGKVTKKKPAPKGQRRSFSPPSHEKESDAEKKTNNNTNGMEDKIVELKMERDRFKQELDKLKDQRGGSNNAELWNQIRELKLQLSEKEHRICELQREKREICRDKFNIESRIGSTRSQCRSPCDVCVHCRSVGPCICLPIPCPEIGPSKIGTARLERERDSARADVERLVEERDILRERLKIATAAHTNEQRRLRDCLSEKESRLAELEREKQNIFLAQGSRRTAITGLEDDLEDAREELRRTKQELTTQRTQYFQLRALQDQTDQALGDVQNQLSQSESELSKAIDRNRSFEQQQCQLDNQVKELKQEINTLRANMARLDQEKDQLLMELDAKTEKIACLEREVSLKEQKTSNTEQQLRDIQHKFQICMGQSAEQERQLRSMQMEVENNQRQLAEASADRENAAQENRRLQDDLAAVSCEIRTLQRELETSRAESYDLKRQLQSYVTEVRRAEELLNRNENDRAELLNHYRSLSLETTVLENNNHSLETEAAETRSALQSARDRLIDLERQLADKDCLNRTYEAQIDELTQTVANLESQVRQQAEQRARTEADLNSVRDLCVQLDQAKENLMKELNEKDAACAQYEAQISRLKAEQCMVQDQMNRDHSAVNRLESMLDQSRQESIETQAINQQLQSEIDRLKQRCCELQNKISAESAELRRYQNQAAEYSKQVGELRRQVTNERFDRARKDEEHRRNLGETNTCPESCGPPTMPTLPTVSTNQTARFDKSGTALTLSPAPHRYSQNTTVEKSRPSTAEQKILEARRANRFSHGDTFKDQRVMEERGVFEVSSVAPGVGEGNSRSVLGCKDLNFKSTLEEDGKHEDLRVEMMDAGSINQSSSGPNNFDNLSRQPKPCYRIQCNASRHEQSQNRFDYGEGMTKKMEQEKSRVKGCGCEYGTEKRLEGCPQDQSIGGNTDREKSQSPEEISSRYGRELENIGAPSSITLEEENIPDTVDLTHPDFLKMLAEIKNQTKTLDKQLTSLNSKMISDLSKIVDAEENDGYNTISYRRVREVEDIHDPQDVQGMSSTLEPPQNTSEFQPPVVSTPERKIDMNHNEILEAGPSKPDASRNPKSHLKNPRIRVTNEKVFTVKKDSFSSTPKIEMIREESIVNIEDSDEKKSKSKIPTRSNDGESSRSKSAGPQFSRSQGEKSKSSTPESVQDARKIRFGSFSFKNSFRKSSRSSPTAPETHDVSTQDSPQKFYDLPEDSRNTGSMQTPRSLGSYEFSESTDNKNSCSVSSRHKKCHMPCAKGYCSNLSNKY